MLYTHQINKKRLITVYKGQEPFRLTPDYIRSDNVDIANEDFDLFAENDLVLLNGQDDPLENGLYLFTNNNLIRYYPTFFDNIDKIYSITETNGITSYSTFFGIGNNLNQLHRILPNQGVIIVCKPEAVLPFDWYTYEKNILPSLKLDSSITNSNLLNLNFLADAKNKQSYSLDLKNYTFKPGVLTYKIGPSSEKKTYRLITKLISCPDPEYLDVIIKVTLAKTDLALNDDLKSFTVSSQVLNDKFHNLLQSGDVVWVINKDYDIDGLYTYDGYGLFVLLYNSDYLIKNKKYYIENSYQEIDSLPDSYYVNNVCYFGYPGHYDFYISLIDKQTNTIVAEDYYCYDISTMSNRPTPTPTMTPTPVIHSVVFDNGEYLKVDNCESCAKLFLGVSAFSLLLEGNYYYEFGVSQQGLPLPRNPDNYGVSFEPQAGFLSTGSFSQKFGTYISVSSKTRTTIFVKLTNLDTGIYNTAYLTLAVCDENYCPPEVTPTPTPTATRIHYAMRPTPTPSVTSSLTPSNTPTISLTPSNTPTQLNSRELYFTNTVDGAWATLSNWWNDSSLTSPAIILPNPQDNIVILADLSTNGLLNAPVVSNITVLNNATLGIDIDVTGIATFNNDSKTEAGQVLDGDAVFNNNAINFATINGNVVFNNSSQNKGYVDGTATFNDTACNDSELGTADTFVPDPPPEC
jgi:hypothetical protein